MATAIAHPNIAVVKYWGKRDHDLNLPATSSISVTLDRFHTRTTVTLDQEEDSIELDGVELVGAEAHRVLRHLDLVLPDRSNARVVSHNNFPTSAGLASSSSGFAALTVAAAAAGGLELTPEGLSRLARQGSGSACRSMWGGFVEWFKGVSHTGRDSHGRNLAPQDHWDLRIVVAVVESKRKKVSSREGMVRTMETSPMYGSFVASSERDLSQVRQAVFDEDLQMLGEAMERSTQKMQATMMTADPPLRYWRSDSVWVVDTVEELRHKGIGCWWTMDAGPNVKVLCEPDDAPAVEAAIKERIERVEVLGVGGPPRLVDDE